MANLSEVDSILDKLNLLNYDAVISRGGTASYLKERIALPVYDIGLWGLDALRRHTACPELPTAHSDHWLRKYHQPCPYFM